MSSPEFLKVYQQAIRALALKARSIKELKDKLMAKDSPPDLVDQVIQRLVAEKLLNDAEFAKGYIRYQLSLRPLGERALSFRLHHLGVDKSTIQNAIHEAFEKAGTALNLARKAIRSKNLTGLTPEKRDAKIARFLAGRGFSYSTIRALIDDSHQKG